MERIGSGGRGRGVARLAGLALLLGASLALTGCQFFFQCAKSSCTDTSTTTTTSTSTGDYAYVANSATGGVDYLAGYEISTGTPIPLSGSPYFLNYQPAAIAIAPNNTLMFISSGLGGLIYAYTIASNGVLSINNNGQAVASETALAMDISADGKYLFVLNEGLAILTVDQFSINSSTGALSLVGSLQIAPTAGGADAIKVAPSEDFVVVSLGSTGDEIFPLVNEVLSAGSTAQLISAPAGEGDFALTIDSNNVLYLARTGLVIPFQVTAAGVPTQITNTVTNSTTGAGDHSIALSKTGAYLYTGNATGTTSGNTNVPNISGFSNSSGNLGLLSGSPYTAPSSVAAIAADNTGKYVVAAGYGSNGVAEYTIGSTGALTVSNNSNATGGTNGVTLLAVTH